MKLPVELQFIANAYLPQKSTEERLDGKLCVITGATSGVGYQAAKRLAQAGADLVLVCRNLEKAQQVRRDILQTFPVQIDVVRADFSRLPDVRAAAAAILEHHGHIDVLINNAGMHNLRRELTDEGYEKVFCVNHLASFLLTRLLLERMIQSAPARIIQVNSQGHRFGGLHLDDLDWRKRPYLGLFGYGASKVAQLLTVRELAEYLKGSHVTINAMHPGAVRTNIGMNNGPLYRFYNRFILRWFLKDASISGEALYYLAAASEMEEVSGRYFNLTIDEVPAPYAVNWQNRKRVVQISEEMTGLEPLRQKMKKKSWGKTEADDEES